MGRVIGPPECICMGRGLWRWYNSCKVLSSIPGIQYSINVAHIIRIFIPEEILLKVFLDNLSMTLPGEMQQNLTSSGFFYPVRHLGNFQQQTFRISSGFTLHQTQSDSKNRYFFQKEINLLNRVIFPFSLNTSKLVREKHSAHYPSEWGIIQHCWVSLTLRLPSEL